MDKLSNSEPESPRSAAIDGSLAVLGAAAVPAETGTIADTRARFGIPRSTLYRLAADGHVRMIKLGRTTLVDFASVRALLFGARASGRNSSSHLNETTARKAVAAANTLKVRR